MDHPLSMRFCLFVSLFLFLSLFLSLLSLSLFHFLSVCFSNFSVSECFGKKSGVFVVCCCFALLFCVVVVVLCCCFVSCGCGFELHPPPPDRPKIRSFFPPAPIFALFVSLWGSSRGILVVFLKRRDPQMYTFGLSGCRVTPPEFHTTAREIQTSTFEAPGASKHHQNSMRRPPEREEKEKKARNFSPPHPSCPHSFSGIGPHTVSVFWAPFAPLAPPIPFALAPPTLPHPSKMPKSVRPWPKPCQTRSCPQKTPPGDTPPGNGRVLHGPISTKARCNSGQFWVALLTIENVRMKKKSRKKEENETKGREKETKGRT